MCQVCFAGNLKARFNKNFTYYPVIINLSNNKHPNHRHRRHRPQLASQVPVFPPL